MSQENVEFVRSVVVQQDRPYDPSRFFELLDKDVEMETFQVLPITRITFAARTP